MTNQASSSAGSIDYLHELDALTAEAIASFLERHGFERAGDNFEKPIADGLRQILTVQRSQSNGPELVRWTIEVAIFSPEIYAARGHASAPEHPSASDSIYFFRIGRLMGGGDPELAYDYWYEMGNKEWTERTRSSIQRVMEGASEPPHRRLEHNADLTGRYDPTDARAARAMVERDLASYVIPFFEKVATRQDLIALLEGPLNTLDARQDVGILQLAAGELTEGQRKLEEFVASSTNTVLVDTVKDFVRSKFGVLL